MIASDLTSYGRNFLWYKDNTELGEVGSREAMDNWGNFVPVFGIGWFSVPLTAYGKLPF